jgi:hypothetical protein
LLSLQENHMRGICPLAEGDKLLGIDRGASETGLDERDCRGWVNSPSLTWA